MEFEQFVKRLDWLDEEHRKNKVSLEDLHEKLDGLEAENKILRKKIKELTSEMSRLATAAGRMEEFDAALTQHRKEITLFITEVEKRREAGLTEVDKRYRTEFDGINKSLAEIKKVKEPIAGLKSEVKSLKEEDIRLNRMITEVQPKIDALLHPIEEIQRSIKVLDGKSRKDEKRVVDLQGEVSAVRKRLDETREKTDITSDGFRRVDIRLNEILASESERRQSQTSFIETQSRLQVDRDRTWKEWQELFDNLARQTEALELQLQNWDSAQRAVKRAQEAYEEITTKFERRINEIAEIQRLGEDRFRQEWVTFKADDQKRWTSFTLSQDENRKDVRADIAKMVERITATEDLTQALQDIIQQTRDADEQMLQAVLAQIHELLSAHERIKGTA